MRSIPARVAALAILGLLGHISSVYGDGWWPFSSQETKKNAEAKRVVAKPTPTQPSVLDKIGSGTKNFFTGVGNAVTGKKPAAPKGPPPDRVAYPANPLTKPDKDASSSWFGSWASPKEEKKETSVKDWLRSGKRGNLDDVK
jgi:hypothetical protein